MEGDLNPKVVGATIIGFALVAGAYTISHFGQTPATDQVAATLAATTPPRAAIEVTDNDNNGIEDWRDEFVTSKPVIVNQEVSTYTPPDTVTGKMSIGFMEGFLSSKGNGPFGATSEKVIDNTINALKQETGRDKIHDTPDITTIDQWDDQDIVNYANTLANIIYTNSNKDLEGELVILNDVVVNKNTDRMSELLALMNVYKGYRDDTIKLPVPKLLTKEHLDLINTYNAIYEDIKGMTLALDDPAVSLLRLKRYEDDVDGLAYALQNMYFSFKAKEELFTKDDPAVLFVIFSPDFKI